MPTPPPNPPPEPPVATAEAPDDHVPMLVRQLLDQGITEKPEDAPDQPPPKPTEPKPEKKPEPETKPPETKPEEGAPPIKLRGPKLTPPKLEFQEPEGSKAPAPTAAAPAPQADPAWESSLDRNEKMLLKDARYMEERFPDRYPGQVAKVTKFLRDHQKFIQDAGEDFDPNSREYKAFIDKNHPKVSEDESREIQETRIADRIKKPFEEKVAELAHKNFVEAEETKIHAEKIKVWEEIKTVSLPDEVQALIKKEGVEAAEKAFPFEFGIARDVLVQATEDIGEYLRLNRKNPETGKPVTEFDQMTEERVAQHKRLVDRQNRICELFDKHATAEQKWRNGKYYVTRQQYAQLTPESRAKAWSFSAKEIVDGMKLLARHDVNATIQSEAKRIEEAGWVRRAPAAPPPVITPDNRAIRETPRPPTPSAVPAHTELAPDNDPNTTTILGNLSKAE